MIERLISITKNVLSYYKSWTFFIAIIALASNAVALYLYETYYQSWLLITVGNSLFLLLIGHSASKANFAVSTISEMAQVIEADKRKTRRQIAKLRRRNQKLQRMTRKSLRVAQRLKLTSARVDGLNAIRQQSRELRQLTIALKQRTTNLEKQAHKLEKETARSEEKTNRLEEKTDRLAEKANRLGERANNLEGKIVSVKRDAKSALLFGKGIDERYSLYLSTHPVFKELNRPTESGLYLNHRLSKERIHRLVSHYIESGLISQETVDYIHNSPEIVLVHQMGKVGSASIHHSLLNLTDDNSPVLHTHNLSKQDFYKVFYGKRLLSQSSRPFLDQRTLISLLLLYELENNFNDRNWTIITAVREPIGRNISAYFQNVNLDIAFPSYSANNSIKDEEIDQAIASFLDNFNHEWPLTWMDTNLKDIFGIDVFEKTFDPAKGYEIYTQDNLKLLLVRLESLNDCYSHAFNKFLDIKDFKLVPTNQASDKKYYDLYKAFRERISFPESYVREMYDSRYAKHFYSQEELASFTSRWKIRSGE
jgi:hypothetical protein